MNIEAVTVCIDYADYLACVIERNAKSVDRWIVVTEERDMATRDLCRKHGVEVVLSDRKTVNGAKFNRGALVNDGLRHCTKDDWILILDADCILPEWFKKQLPQELDRRCLYGAVRALYTTYEMWSARTPEKYDSSLFAFGYFQLYHGQTHSDIMYPENYPSAEMSDTMFRNLPYWKQHVMLDVTVDHLGPTVANWGGRNSQRWEPHDAI